MASYRQYQSYPHSGSTSLPSSSADPRLRQRSNLPPDRQSTAHDPKPYQASARHTDAFSTKPYMSAALQISSVHKPAQRTADSPTKPAQRTADSPTKLPPRLLRSLEDLIESEPFETEAPMVKETKSANVNNYCSACNMAFRTREHYEHHIMGREHIANMKEQREREMLATQPKQTPGGASYDSNTQQQSGPTPAESNATQESIYSFCQVCKLSCPDETSWNAHVSSAEHINKLKAYETTIMGLLAQSKSGQLQLPFLNPSPPGNSSQSPSSVTAAAAQNVGQSGLAQLYQNVSSSAQLHHAQHPQPAHQAQQNQAPSDQVQHYQNQAPSDQVQHYQNQAPSDQVQHYQNQAPSDQVQHYQNQAPSDQVQHYQNQASSDQVQHYQNQAPSDQVQHYQNQAPSDQVQHYQNQAPSDQVQHYQNQAPSDQVQHYQNQAPSDQVQHYQNQAPSDQVQHYQNQAPSDQVQHYQNQAPSDQVQHYQNQASSDQVQHYQNQAPSDQVQHYQNQAPSDQVQHYQNQAPSDQVQHYQNQAPSDQVQHYQNQAPSDQVQHYQNQAAFSSNMEATQPVTMETLAPTQRHLPEDTSNQPAFVNNPRHFPSLNLQQEMDVSQEHMEGSQNQPRFAQNQPHFRQDQSQFDQNQLQFGENQPGFGQNQPQFDRNQPQSGQNEPQFDQNQPQFGQNLQQFGQNQPQFGQNQSQFGNQQGPMVSQGFEGQQGQFGGQPEDSQPITGQQQYTGQGHNKGQQGFDNAFWHDEYLSYPEGQTGYTEAYGGWEEEAFYEDGLAPGYEAVYHEKPDESGAPYRGRVHQGRLHRARGFSRDSRGHQDEGQDHMQDKDRGHRHVNDHRGCQRYDDRCDTIREDDRRRPVHREERQQRDSGPKQENSQRGHPRSEARGRGGNGGRGRGRLDEGTQWSFDQEEQFSKSCPLCEIEFWQEADWQKHIYTPQHKRNYRQAQEELGQLGLRARFGDVPNPFVDPNQDGDKKNQDNYIWYCPDCGNDNYAFRTVCHRCPRSRPHEFIPPAEVRDHHNRSGDTSRGRGRGLGSQPRGRGGELQRRSQHRPQPDHGWNTEDWGNEGGWGQEDSNQLEGQHSGQRSRPQGGWMDEDPRGHGSQRFGSEERIAHRESRFAANHQRALREIAAVIDHLDLNPGKKQEIHCILMKHVEENPDLNMDTLKSLVQTFMSLQPASYHGNRRADPPPGPVHADMRGPKDQPARGPGPRHIPPSGLGPRDKQARGRPGPREDTHRMDGATLFPGASVVKPLMDFRGIKPPSNFWGDGSRSDVSQMDQSQKRSYPDKKDNERSRSARQTENKSKNGSQNRHTESERRNDRPSDNPNNAARKDNEERPGKYAAPPTSERMMTRSRSKGISETGNSSSGFNENTNAGKSLAAETATRKPDVNKRQDQDAESKQREADRLILQQELCGGGGGMMPHNNTTAPTNKPHQEHRQDSQKKDAMIRSGPRPRSQINEELDQQIVETILAMSDSSGHHQVAQAISQLKQTNPSAVRILSSRPASDPAFKSIVSDVMRLPIKRPSASSHGPNQFVKKKRNILRHS